MKGRLFALLFLFLLLSAPTFDITSDQQFSNNKFRNRLAGFDSPAPLQLCDVVQSGDKSGAWECIKGDGTMLTGSATTWTSTGSPTNTTEGSGYPVRTYTSGQNDQQPANGAFPASSFSICKHHRSATIGVAQLSAFGLNGSGPPAYTALPYQQDGSGNLISIISDGTNANGFYTSTASPLPMVANTWYLVCFTYSRVGGASNNVGITYVNATQVGTSTGMSLAQAQSTKWTTNGYTGAGLGQASSMRGQFITYKVLSAADITRIYNAIEN